MSFGHTIFFLLGGRTMYLFAPQGAIKCTLWSVSRKNNLAINLSCKLDGPIIRCFVGFASSWKTQRADWFFSRDHMHISMIRHHLRCYKRDLMNLIWIVSMFPFSIWHEPLFYHSINCEGFNANYWYTLLSCLTCPTIRLYFSLSFSRQ